MRAPVNRGTDKRPQYGGVAQRHRGQQFWVSGWFGRIADYERAYRAECDRIDAELAGDRPSATSQRTVSQYARLDWMHINPRGKEQTRIKYAGSLVRDKATGLPLDSGERTGKGDIGPLIDEFGERRFEEIDFFSARSWMASQPTRVVRACRACWNDAMRDLHMLLDNPFAKPNRPEEKGRSGEAITVLTETEVDLLCQCAIDAWPGPYGLIHAACIRFLAETGCRPGEAWGMEWSWLHPDIEEADVFPWLRDPKTGELLGKTYSSTRTIYVATPAWEALAQTPRLSERYAFPAPRGGLMVSSLWDRYFGKTRALFMSRLPAGHHLHERMARMAAAGKDPNGVRAEGQGAFVAYELRHCFATRTLNAGYAGMLSGGGAQDLASFVAWQFGHKDGDPSLVYRVYGHPDAALARNVLRQVERARQAGRDQSQLAALQDARRKRDA